MEDLPVIREPSWTPETPLKSWWLKNVHTMAKEGISVWAVCDACGRDWKVDLQALAERVPYEYSLINRRSRCRLTPGCTGWTVFWHQGSWFSGKKLDIETRLRLPLFDRKTYARWVLTPVSDEDDQSPPLS